MKLKNKVEYSLLDVEFKRTFKNIFLASDDRYLIQKIFKELQLIENIQALMEIKYRVTDGEDIFDVLNDVLLKYIKEEPELCRLYLVLNGFDNLEDYIAFSKTL